MNTALGLMALQLARGFFGLNFALGLSLQLGSSWHPRPLHHALYFLTCACTGGALLLARQGNQARLLAAVLGGLLLMSRTRPGRPAHAMLACALGAGFALAGRERR